jgi:hypothetical protein
MYPFNVFKSDESGIILEYLREKNQPWKLHVNLEGPQDYCCSSENQYLIDLLLI